MIIIFYVISYLSIAIAFSIFLILATKKEKGDSRFRGDSYTLFLALIWPITLPSFIFFLICSSLVHLLKKIEEEINKLP